MPKTVAKIKKPDSGLNTEGLYFDAFYFEDPEQINSLLSNSYHYRIIFLIDGNCECRSGEQVFCLTGNTIGLMRPGQHLRLRRGQMGRGYVLTFSFDFMQAAFNSAGLAQDFHRRAGVGSLAAPAEDIQFLSDVVERLRKEYLVNRGLKDQILQGLFQVLLLFLNRISVARGVGAEGRCGWHVSRFFTLLDEHFARLRMPAEYANLMAVTPSYLNYIIKKYLGYTTGHFIQQRILSEALKMMALPEVSMKEVAYGLGFGDVSHFSKFFKRNTGKSFTDFRRNRAA